MSTMIGDAGERVTSARKAAGRSLDRMRDQVDTQTMYRAGIVAGVALAVIGIGVAVLVYRSWKTSSAVARFRDSVVSSMPDVLAGLKSVRP